jgi:hypothetical protein
MTIELGPLAYRYLTESRPWVFAAFVLFLWCRIAMSIILRPRVGIGGQR